MEKIISLIIAAFMACSGFVGAYEKPAIGDNEMRVTIVNETEDAVSGFDMDYIIDGVNEGGSGGMVAGGTMSKGEELDLDLMLDRFDLESKESFDFKMVLKAYLEDGTTVDVEYFAQWEAEPQGEYTFVVSGSQAEGYELTVKDADFDCTIAPLA